MAASKIFSRDFVLGFFAQFAFSSVFCILMPTLPIYLAKKGNTEPEIGLLIGTFSVFSLLFRPFVGRSLLRIPEREFMLAGASLYLLSSVAYLFAPPFWPFLMVRVIHGIGLALFATASFTFIANISPGAHRGQSLSYFYLAINIAFIVGPYLGMLIINHLDFTTLFILCAALSACSLFITFRLGKSESIHMDRPPHAQPILSREALPPAVMAFMVNIIWGALTAFFPLYAVSQGITNPGLFFGTLAVVHILGRSLGGRIFDRYSREQVIFPCLITYIIAMAVLVLSKTLIMFILVAVIWGIGNAFLYPTLVAFALDRAGAAPGPAMGTFTAVADLGSGMGSVIMGIVLHWTSYPIMFLCLALIGVLNLSYFYLFIKKRGGHPYANL